MFKGLVFSLGLANGAFVGIKMRDAGFATALTKSYYNNNKIPNNNPILNMEPKELNELYEKGILNSPEKLENFALIKNVEDLERMQEFLNKERQDKLDRQSANVNKN
jgi:hypothetical protein